MSAKPAPEITGRDFYNELYKNSSELEDQWLRFGASDKVDTIEYLLARHRVRASSILELGCGTGAVIEECARRGLASDLSAVDYSAEAIARLRRRLPGVTTIVGDVMTLDDARLTRHFDVLILSHVLEHLEDPAALLRRLRQHFRYSYLIAEVPLENLFASRVKRLITGNLPSRAGHVQFYTPQSFLDLIGSTGHHRLADRSYVPNMTSQMIRFQGRKDGAPTWMTGLRHISGWLLPRWSAPLYKRFYYAHYGVLCTRAHG